MPLSFRSNVNYIPPPQEVSLLYFILLCVLFVALYHVGHTVVTWAVHTSLMNVAGFEITLSPRCIAEGHVSETNIKTKSVTQWLFLFCVSLCVSQPQDFKHTQSFMLWEAGLPLRIHQSWKGAKTGFSDLPPPPPDSLSSRSSSTC